MTKYVRHLGSLYLISTFGDLVKEIMEKDEALEVDVLAMKKGDRKAVAANMKILSGYVQRALDCVFSSGRQALHWFDFFFISPSH